MAFSDVAFAFKQIITSAKLNQLMENIRTHDHISTGQGDKFGRIGGAGTGTNVSSTTTAFIAAISASIVVPSGITDARRVELRGTCRIRQDSGSVGNVLGSFFIGTTEVFGLGAVAIPSSGPGYNFIFSGIILVPPAGTHTISLRFANATTGGWTTLDAAVDAFII